ncbi:glycosyltransferase family 4 protein [Brachyspira intermedia]|uniref:glycosyltransferase family 4 protein n=1 Tax=Brachyspira intermedia TaxID=84377 RepID=UPI003003EE9F
MQYKIAFVAHEFGFFKGHGGIASYLYNIVKYILENHNNYKVYVLIIEYDKNCDLLDNNNLSIVNIKSESDVLEELEKISPNYVEVADFLAFCIDSLIQKHLGKKFTNTIFAVHHHTAIRECYIWNSKLPLKYANYEIKNQFEKEKAQILLSDIQIAPSQFMANYVKQNYYINDDIKVYNHYIDINFTDKNTLYNEFINYYDLENYKDCFNIVLITRIEGRKNQEYLINEFINFKESNNIKNTNLFLIGNTNKDEITGEDIVFDLYKKVEEKYRDCIFFYDFADSNTKKLFYSIADLSILPSYYENFPMAIIETLCYGIPIMASKNSGCMDYIGSTVDYMSFDPFKTGDLSKKIESFYKMTPKEKNDIINIQQNTLKNISDPSISIDNRLTLFNNYITKDKFYIKDFDIIEPCDIINKTPITTNKPIVYIPNDINKNLVIEFINSFYFNNNLIDKIIILSNHYIAINDTMDIVYNELPIIIINHNPITNLIEYINDNLQYTVQISIDKLKENNNKSIKTQTLFKECLIAENSNKNMLKELYNDK